MWSPGPKTRSVHCASVLPAGFRVAASGSPRVPCQRWIPCWANSRIPVRQQLPCSAHTAAESSLTDSWMSDQQVVDPASWTRPNQLPHRSSPTKAGRGAGSSKSNPGRGWSGDSPDRFGYAPRSGRPRHPHRSAYAPPLQKTSTTATLSARAGRTLVCRSRVDWTPRRRQCRTSFPCRVIHLPVNGILSNLTAVWAQAPGASNGSPAGCGWFHGAVDAARNGGRPRLRCNASGHSASASARSRSRRHFFDLGGDSLMAINIAMARRQGLTITPQDLYEYPTLASLTRPPSLPRSRPAG